MSDSKKSIIFLIAKIWFFIGLIIGCIFFPALLVVSLPFSTIFYLFIGGLFVFIIIPVFLLYITSSSEKTVTYYKIFPKYQFAIPEDGKAGAVYEIIDVEKEQLEKYIDEELRNVK